MVAVLKPVHESKQNAKIFISSIVTLKFDHCLRSRIDGGSPHEDGSFCRRDGIACVERQKLGFNLLENSWEM